MATQRDNGYRLGYNHGYHLGRCRAALQSVPGPEPIFFDKKVMYITSGMGYPYTPLDRTIAEHARQLVREFIWARPDDDFVEMAARMRPDLVLVLDGTQLLDLRKIQELRCMGIPCAVWFADDPYYTDSTVKVAAVFDYVFTLELNCVSFYRDRGCPQVHHLPFAANPQVFTPKPVPIEYRTDILFIGSGFWNRIRFFDSIAPYLAARKTLFVGLWWNRLRNYRLLADKIRLNTWMTPEETALYYNGAKVVINLHRAHDDDTYNQNSIGLEARSVNPRTFEIAACGTLQVSDNRMDLARFYEPGKEIVTYSSPAELTRIIDYYLEREEERREIAVNAARRTALEHTYDRRLATMLRIVFGQ